MLNLSTLKKCQNASPDYLVIGSKGKIKGESNEIGYLVYSANVTLSGVRVWAWINLLLSVHAKAGRRGGPPTTDWNNVILK